MAQFSNSADLPTDAYPATSSATPIANGPDLNQNKKKAAGVAAAALLLGGSAWSVKQDRSDGLRDNESIIDPGAIDEPTLELPREIDVAGKVTDAMSFDQAFAAAREEVGMAGVFGWHGRWYNTFLKEEWNELSVQQRLDFTEMVTHEHLPVKPYEQVAGDTQKTTEILSETETTLIEGHINGHRVMGLDFDQDGVIDTLVMDAKDGYTYRVVDAVGDQGLDTVYKYDALDGEWMMVEKIVHPFVLSNDNFSQDLEESMSKEVVDSILELDTTTPDAPVNEPEIKSEIDSPEDTDPTYLVDTYEADDDTYNNHGDVRDMDE